MDFIAPFTVAERLAWSLEGLCKAVAARIAPGIAGWAMQAVMIVAIWTRIRRVEGKLQRLLARFLAGRLRVVSRDQGVAVSRAPTEKVPRVPTAKLPRSFAWLCVMVPYEAAGFASQLRVVLAEPEMQGLLAASSQARRVLAPLGRMLGIERELLGFPAPAPTAKLPRTSGVTEEVSLAEDDLGRHRGYEVAPGLPVPLEPAAAPRARWSGD